MVLRKTCKSSIHGIASFNWRQLSHKAYRATGSFDDRSLTLMTESTFEVMWRVGNTFWHANLEEKPSGILWWMRKRVGLERKQLTVISFANKATADQHFRVFLRKVTRNCYLFHSPSLLSSLTCMYNKILLLRATFLPDLNPKLSGI